MWNYHSQSSHWTPCWPLCTFFVLCPHSSSFLTTASLASHPPVVFFLSFSKFFVPLICVYLCKSSTSCTFLSSCISSTVILCTGISVLLEISDVASSLQVAKRDRPLQFSSCFLIPFLFVQLHFFSPRNLKCWGNDVTYRWRHIPSTVLAAARLSLRYIKLSSYLCMRTGAPLWSGEGQSGPRKS